MIDVPDVDAEATRGVCGMDSCTNEIVLDDACAIEEGVSDGRHGFATVVLLVCGPCYAKHHANLTGTAP